MPTEEKILDFIDGRLSERDRALFAAYLITHPEIASEVNRLRLVDDMVRGVSQDVLDEPVPAHLLEIVRNAVEASGNDV